MGFVNCLILMLWQQFQFSIHYVVLCFLQSNVLGLYWCAVSFLRCVNFFRLFHVSEKSNKSDGFNHAAVLKRAIYV